MVMQVHVLKNSIFLNKRFKSNDKMITLTLSSDQRSMQAGCNKSNRKNFAKDS